MPVRTPCVLAVGTAVVALWTAAPRAQQPAPPQNPTVFKATVDLVQVDVVVTDLDGNPIKGLTQADFVVRDRSRPQTIAAFQEVAHNYARDEMAPPLAVRHDVSDNRTAQSQRLVVVVVDDLHIFRGRTDKAKELTKQVIDTLGAEASMALLFTSGAHGTEVTEDKSLLLAAADRLKGLQALRRPHEANDRQSVHGLDPEMSSDQIRAAIGQAGSAQDFFENMAQYKTLEDAARMIGGNDLRRKAFVLISEGINKDLTGVFTGTATPCEMQPPTQSSIPTAAAPSRRGAAPATSISTPASPTPCYHEDALRQTAEAMRKSNVTMYALDPRGHVSDQDLAIEGFGSPKGLLTTPNGKATDDESPFRMTNPIRLAQEGLDRMSSATGGFAVTDTDDFDSGIDHILGDLDHFYLLGFLPPDPTGKGYRPIEVSTPGHPDYVLRFRAGYTPSGPADLPANADPLLSAALPKTDVPLRLFAEAFPMPPQPPAPSTSFDAAPTPPPSKNAVHPSRVAVDLEVTLPTAMLLQPDGKLHDDVTLKLVAINAGDGKLAGRVSRGASLVMKPIAASAGPPPPTVAYQVESSIDLPPGSYQLRASMTSGRASAGGSVYLPVDVPDFSKPALALSGIALGYAEGDRVAVAPSALADGGGPSLVPFVPTLDRLFKPADTLRVFCEVRRAAPTDAVHVAIQAISANGTVVKAVTQDLSGAATAGAGPAPTDHVDQRLALADLPAGAYRLRVTATRNGSSVAQELGFIVH